MVDNPKEVRMTSAQIITAIPYDDEPEMRVYTVESLEELLSEYTALQDDRIAEFIVDIQVVHWDEDPVEPERLRED